MLSVIQLVTQADVRVENVVIGAIQKGILALIGIEKTDTKKEVEKLFNKIVNYRIVLDPEVKTEHIWFWERPEVPPKVGKTHKNGAPGRIRTSDPLVRSQWV
jgi:hypothetical protein